MVCHRPRLVWASWPGHKTPVGTTLTQTPAAWASPSPTPHPAATMRRTVGAGRGLCTAVQLQALPASQADTTQ